MADHYLYPYTGDSLNTLVANAQADDKIIVMPGVHMVKLQGATEGISCNKTLTFEGRPSSDGVLPVIELYNENGSRYIINVNDANAFIWMKRIIWRLWGIRNVYNPIAYRGFFDITSAKTLQIEQCAFMGNSSRNAYGNYMSAFKVSAIDEIINIRNCTFANFSRGVEIYDSAIYGITFNNCNFYNIDTYAIYALGSGIVIDTHYCNFYNITTSKYYASGGAGVNEYYPYAYQPRMFTDIAHDNYMYNISRLQWQAGHAYVFGFDGINRAVFSYYTYGGGTASYQGPNVYASCKLTQSIDADEYKHIYVGAVSIWPNSAQGKNRPFLRWTKNANIYTSPWDYDDGYKFDTTLFTAAKQGAMYGTPLKILHKNMSGNSDWAGTINTLTYGPFYDNNNTYTELIWTAVGFIIISKEAIDANNAWEMLIQYGAGSKDPATDSDLINWGDPTTYDDYLAPYTDQYIGRLGVFADIGVYGGITQTPYIPYNPYFDTLLPSDGVTIETLGTISIHFKAHEESSMALNESSIEVQLFGRRYSLSNPSDELVTLAITGTDTDYLITLTLTDETPDDPVIVTFTGQDVANTYATPYKAIYYLWAGRGDINNPFIFEPATIIPYANPAPIPARWEHCYDRIEVSWQNEFDDVEGLVERGINKGARKTLSLTDNPLIQTQNLAGHAADLMLERFGKERKIIKQKLPFAPVMDLYNAVKLLYPSKYYRISKVRNWIITVLNLSSKTGDIDFEGVESYES